MVWGKDKRRLERNNCFFFLDIGIIGGFIKG